MAIEQLEVTITASGIVTADLTEVSTLRSTQEVVQILYEIDPELRSTQEVVQVLYEVDPELRSTQEVVQILYTTHISGIQSLEVDIVTSASVVADLTLPTLSSNIQASANVTATLVGKRQFNVNITATGNIDASLTSLVKLVTSIAVSGNVSANLRENVEYLAVGISASGNITSADMNVPWHAGNTLQLTQEAIPQIVLSHTASQTLNLQHQVDLIFGQRFLYASNSILFTQEATNKKVLPTKTASSTLVLTQTLSEYREAINYLILIQSAVGTLYFTECFASNTLNLTHSASTAGTIFNLSAENQLNLTQNVNSDQEQSLTIVSNLNLNHNAFAVLLESKKYILLQAPFELIQTSVVLPNPLLDDSENLALDLILRRSMNNTPYTYVRTSNNRRLKYTFTLDRYKALELEEFFNSYNGANIKMLNWKGEVWKVKLITNPIDYVQTARFRLNEDRTDVNLEFEGELIRG